MSNHLAVAAVSSTLVHQLRDPVSTAITGADVYNDRPLTAISNGDQPEVRIFLYGVQYNAALRNNDLPTRRPGGGVAEKPQAAVDLSYLISFTGNERKLEPQILLGAVVRELHARPILGRDDIRRMIAEGVAGDRKFALAAADLADQAELVRFTPQSLDLEEMSKLWSVFFQAPYQLSVAYQASVVLINPEMTVQPALPVTAPRIFADTVRRPTIARIVSSGSPLDLVTAGSEVVIEGTQLRGDKTVVWFGATDVEPPAGSTNDREIRITVPASIHSGLVAVRVEHLKALDAQTSERIVGVSNLAPVIVRPVIRPRTGGHEISIPTVSSRAGLRSGTLRVLVDPPVGREQRVNVLLNQVNVPEGQSSHSYALSRPAITDTDEPEETNEVLVPFKDVPVGGYLVRVQVDGAESALSRDGDDASPTFQQYVAPRVNLT